MSLPRVLLAFSAALALAGCASRGVAPMPPAPPPPGAGALDTLPPAVGAVTAPWDTAARAGASRRAHVYPQGESEIGRRLVASLPDPGGLPSAEGPPATAGCWEVQLTVTSDAARAERVRAEAAALLGVPVRIVSEDGVHRVRAGGCLDAGAALRLVERARAEGWPEAFRSEAGR